MRIPQITFNEASVGFAPIQSNVRNRIAIIGQFNRGFANTFIYLNGFTQFANLYGSDNSSGSIALQAAWDQGARDFAVIRVLGNSKPAKGTIILGGTASKDNNIDLKIAGIGNPTPALGSYFRNDITVNGGYTGSESGRYIVVATNVDDETAVEFKYKFISFQEESSADQAIALVTPTVLSEITTAPGETQGEGVFTLDSTLTAGPDTVVEIENGINILFGDAGENLVFDKAGHIFTIIAEAWSFNIPVNVNDTAVELANSFMNVLSGADPLGKIDSKLDYLPSNTTVYTNTLDFYFDNSIVPGSEGNQYYFYLDLDEPDGVFNVKCYYDGTNNANQLLSTDPDVANLAVGDEITVPAGSKFVIQPGTTITGINGVGSAVDPYVIDTSDANITTVNGDIQANEAQTVYFDDADQTGGLSIDKYQEFVSFEGGEDGPRRASVNLFSYTGTRLFEFQAVSEGQWGNNVRLDIDPQPGTGWRVTITDLEGSTLNPPVESETYFVDLTEPNTVDDLGEVEQFKDSNLVRVFFVPKAIDASGFNTALLTETPVRLAPPVSTNIISNEEDIAHVTHFGPERLNSVSLEGGFDGPILEEEDFINAINVVEGEQANIILCPGIDTNSPQAQAALVAAAEGGSELDGLKIAVLNTKPNLKPTAAHRESIAINSSRAVMVTGWATYAGQPTTEAFNCSPDALYAGMLATIGFQVSPAAKTSAGPVFGISAVDNFKYLSKPSLQMYADARIEVLRPDVNLGGFFFLTGGTSSSNTAWNKVVIRRTYDVIRQDLYGALQPYQSEPHTKLLRRQIETSVNAYFQSLLRNNKIANALPAICNDSNNPSENYITGELNVSVGFLPLYAADYINITLSRNTSGGLQIGGE